MQGINCAQSTATAVETATEDTSSVIIAYKYHLGITESMISECQNLWFRTYGFGGSHTSGWYILRYHLPAWVSLCCTRFWRIYHPKKLIFLQKRIHAKILWWMQNLYRV